MGLSKEISVPMLRSDKILQVAVLLGVVGFAYRSRLPITKSLILLKWKWYFSGKGGQMHKRILLISLLMISPFFCTISFAETILLKSGKTIEAKIIDKTDKYIKIDIEGVPLTYFFDDIEAIDGKKITLSLQQSNPATQNQKTEPKNQVSPAPTPKSEIVVYLKSGEIIKGLIVNKTADSIVIEKNGNTLALENDEILRTEDAQNVDLTAAPVDLSVPTAKPSFSTAIISYSYSGGVTGYETTYIDMKKNKISTESARTSSFGNISSHKHERVIYDGKILYSLEPERNEGMKEERKGDIILTIFDESSFLKYPVEKEKKTVLGKECKVYDFPEGKVYFWQGIILKQEITKHPMGDAFNHTKEATSIKLDATIPDEAFTIPFGVKFITPEEIMKKLTGMMKKGCPLK